MDKSHFDEMSANYLFYRSEGAFESKRIYLFGHCSATELLADMFLSDGYKVEAILDNNVLKHESAYNGIKIISPESVCGVKDAVVCIAARAFAAMKKQLVGAGFEGGILKLVEYDSFSEFSLDGGTLKKMRDRLERGLELRGKYSARFGEALRIYCPFSALGDVYYTMAYLPHYLAERGVSEYAVFTVGNACASVARMFGAENIVPLSGKEMDEQLQAVIYLNDDRAFIAHYDRPYVSNLYRSLSLKKFTLEEMYKYGVFGLPKEALPYRPSRLSEYSGNADIPEGKAVIVSPYAKSVTNLPEAYWEGIVSRYSAKGYAVYTNVSEGETPLPGTSELRARLDEINSAVERAGEFIGIRSGLCDVIRYAGCKKTAVYPDAFYSGTRWRMEEIYHLDGWENIIVYQ